MAVKTWIDGPGINTSVTTTFTSGWSASTARFRDVRMPFKTSGQIQKLTFKGVLSTATGFYLSIFRGGTEKSPASRVWLSSVLTPTVSNLDLTFDGLDVAVEAGDHLAFEWYGGTLDATCKMYKETMGTGYGYYCYDSGEDINGPHLVGDWSQSTNTMNFMWEAEIETEDYVIYEKSSPSGEEFVSQCVDGMNYFMFEDIVVAKGDALQIEFQEHNRNGYSSWPILTNGGWEARLKLDFTGNGFIQFHDTSVGVTRKVDLEYNNIALSESPTTTTIWSAGGLTMTNGSATWATGADTARVWNGYKVRVTAGTGVTIGDYRVKTISDTVITLYSSPGATPSNVTYTIVRDEANDTFDILVWMDILTKTLNLLWMNKSTGQGGEYTVASYDLTWKSIATVIDDERGNIYRLDDGIEEDVFYHTVRRIDISGTATIGKLIVLREPVIIVGDSYGAITNHEAGGGLPNGLTTYIGDSMTPVRKSLMGSVSGAYTAVVESGDWHGKTSISSRYGLHPSFGTLDVSTVGVHDICEFPQAVIVPWASINDTYSETVEFDMQQALSAIISRFSEILEDPIQRKTFEPDNSTTQMLGYGQQIVLCTMVYVPHTNRAQALMQQALIDKFNLTLQVLASLSNVTFAKTGASISRKTAYSDSGTTYYGGFFAGYQSTAGDVHPNDAGYEEMADTIANAVESTSSASNLGPSWYSIVVPTV